MAKRKPRATTEVIIPLDDTVLSKLKKDPKTGLVYPLRYTIELTIYHLAHAGSLHLQAHMSKPRVERLKGARGRGAG